MDPKSIAAITHEPKPAVAPVRTTAVAYPFLTRREIAARIDADAAFAGECALVLEARAQQRAAGESPAGKPWGWMSSERVVAGRLVVKFRDGSLTNSDQGKLAALMRRYSRQLADHCRGLALTEHPELAVIAAKFGALPAGSAPHIPVQAQPEPKEVAQRCHPVQDREPDRLEDDLDSDEEPVPDDELPPRVIAHVDLAPGHRTVSVQATAS
jgi:hypothetical protein